MRIFVGFGFNDRDSWIGAWQTRLEDVDPASVAQLDSVEHIDDLVRVGQALAKEVKLEHFLLERFGQFYQ